jgi:hypothetical protein
VQNGTAKLYIHTVIWGRVLCSQPVSRGQKVILDGIVTVRAACKAAGILSTDLALAQ